MRILSGIQPSGKLHIGNYFGAIRQFLQLQEDGHEGYYFLANYHALTSLQDKAALEELTLHLAAGYLALGIDPDRSVFFLQSDVPETTELCWFLNTVCPVSLMNKAHSFKDKTAKGLPANMALLDYPVLQAGDITIFDAELVPVGQDQKQHVEMTRDLAVKFNMTYGGRSATGKSDSGCSQEGVEILKVPEPRILDQVAVVPGIDGKKMSKSYANTIEIFQTAKQTKKRCGKIVTDSTPLEAPKDPEGCNVYALLKLFCDEAELAEIAASYRAGGYGYGHAKNALAEKINDLFGDAREKYDALMADPDTLRDILREGGKKARATAQVVMQRVRAAAGIMTTY